MLSWDEIISGARSHFADAAESGRWLRFTVAASSAPQLIAVRRAEIVGIDVLVLLADVAPFDAVSVFVATQASLGLGAASLLLCNNHYAIRLVVPLAMLDWKTLKSGVAQLARMAQTIRDDAKAEQQRPIGFQNYA